MTSSKFAPSRVNRVLGLGLVSLVALALTGCVGGSTAGTDSIPTESEADAPIGLMDEGVLVVGMNLQFKPQMYLDDDGEPAGYDVELLEALARSLNVELQIQNIDFGGLIPGLQSNKYDMVSVGLSPTPERKKVVGFSQEYVPYTTVLAGQADSSLKASIDAYNKPEITITALQGGTAEQIAFKTFPDADVVGYADVNSAFLQVATGRAQGVVVQDYLLADYQTANPNEVERVDLAEPLQVNYGSWAVQKGNDLLLKRLDGFLCEAIASGELETLYKKVFGVDVFSGMPNHC